jgi:hypothetical protein
MPVLSLISPSSPKQLGMVSPELHQLGLSRCRRDSAIRLSNERRVPDCLQNVLVSGHKSSSVVYHSFCPGRKSRW